MKMRVLVDLHLRLAPEPEQWSALRVALPGNRLRRSYRRDADGLRTRVPMLVEARTITDAAEIGVERVWAAADRVFGSDAFVPQTCEVRRTGIGAVRERNINHHVDCCLIPPTRGFGPAGDREPLRPVPGGFPPAAVAAEISRRPGPDAIASAAHRSRRG